MLFLTIFLQFSSKTESERLKLALAIPTGAPITVASDAIDMLPAITDKKLMIYQNS